MLHAFDKLSLHLVNGSEARIGAWLRAPGLSIQYEVLLCEAKFTLTKLDKRREYWGDNLDTYVKRFLEKVLRCCDPATEDVLADACLHGMMEVARRTKKSLKKTSKYISLLKCLSKKRPMIAAVDKNKGANGSSSKKGLITGEAIYLLQLIPWRARKSNSFRAMD